MNKYKYNNEYIYAENRWTAWIIAKAMFKEENVIIRRDKYE